MEGSYGPKMSALTEKQRLFVEALFMPGVHNATLAAERAGYSAMSGNSLRVQGHRLWHDARIQEAIIECSQRFTRGVLPLALSVAMEVMENKQASGAERLKAVEFFANRAGLHGVTEHRSTVEHIGQDPDQMKRIAMLASALGGSLETVLGRRLALEAPLIDVTPEPFEDEDY